MALPFLLNENSQKIVSDNNTTPAELSRQLGLQYADSLTRHSPQEVEAHYRNNFGWAPYTGQRDGNVVKNLIFGTEVKPTGTPGNFVDQSDPQGTPRAPVNTLAPSQSSIEAFTNADTEARTGGGIGAILETQTVAAPEDVEAFPIASMAGNLLGTLKSDMPLMIAGAVAGAPAGPLGVAIGATVGAMIPAATRTWMSLKARFGEVDGFDEAFEQVGPLIGQVVQGESIDPERLAKVTKYWDKVLPRLYASGTEAGKAGNIVAASMIAPALASSGASTYLAGLSQNAFSAKPLAATMSNVERVALLTGLVGAENAGVAGASLISEGRMPSASEYVLNSMASFGVRGTMAGVSKGLNLWDHFGLGPEELKSKIISDPKFKQAYMTESSYRVRPKYQEYFHFESGNQTLNFTGPEGQAQFTVSPTNWLYTSEASAERAIAQVQGPLEEQLLDVGIRLKELNRQETGLAQVANRPGTPTKVYDQLDALRQEKQAVLEEQNLIRNQLPEDRPAAVLQVVEVKKDARTIDLANDPYNPNKNARLVAQKMLGHVPSDSEISKFISNPGEEFFDRIKETPFSMEEIRQLAGTNDLKTTLVDEVNELYTVDWKGMSLDDRYMPFEDRTIRPGRGINPRSQLNAAAQTQLDAIKTDMVKSGLKDTEGATTFLKDAALALEDTLGLNSAEWLSRWNVAPITKTVKGRRKAAIDVQQLGPRSFLSTIQEEGATVTYNGQAATLLGDVPEAKLLEQFSAGVLQTALESDDIVAKNLVKAMGKNPEAFQAKLVKYWQTGKVDNPWSARLLQGFKDFTQGNPKLQEVLDGLIKPPMERAASYEGALKTMGDAIAFTPVARTAKEWFRKTKLNMRTNFFDKYAPLNVVEKEGQYTQSYIEARTRTNSIDRAGLALTDGTFDWNGNLTGESLAKIVNDAGDPQELSKYLAAKQLTASYAKGDSLPVNRSKIIEAARVVQEVGDRKPELAALGQRVRDFHIRALDYARQSGVLSKEEFDKWNADPRMFIPLREAAGSAEQSLMSAGSVKMDDPLELLTAEVLRLYKLADVNQVKRSIAKDFGWAGEAFPLDKAPEMAMVKGYTNPLSSITHFENGAEIRTYLPREIAEVAQNLTPLTSRLGGGILRNLFKWPARALRGGTTLNPAFMLKNFMRDQVTAYTQSGTGYQLGVDFVKSFKSAARLGGIDDAYREWIKAGGSNSSMISEGLNQYQGAVDRLRSQNIWNVVKDPQLKYLNPLFVAKRSLEYAAESVENASRLGEFQRARAMGFSDQEAAFMSREVTLDFARSGLIGQALNAYVPFFNASLQGISKSVRMLREQPGSFLARSALSVFLPTALITIANEDLKKNSPSSDGAVALSEVPEWEDVSFLMMPFGEDGKYLLKLPAPQGILGNIMALAKSFVRFAYTDDKIDWLKDLGSMQIESANNARVPILPSALALPLEIYTNKNMFTGNAIVPHNMQKLLPVDQYKPDTTVVAKSVANLFEQSGLPVGPPSPIVIDHLIKGIGGGLAQAISQGIDYLMPPESMARPDKRWNELPLVKSFFVQYPTYGAKSIEKFNEDAQKYNATYMSLQAAARRGDISRAESLIATGEAINLAKVMNTMGSITSAIQKINYNKDMKGYEKRQHIDTLMFNMIGVARIGNNFLENLNAGK